MKVVWLAPSRQDLADIIHYVAEDNPQAAIELDDDILSAAAGLNSFPQRGRPGRVEGTRELIVRKNYIVVYKLLEDKVLILTVLHAARQ
jgi:addiction module RelE/StbE family toxin